MDQQTENALTVQLILGEADLVESGMWRTSMAAMAGSHPLFAVAVRPSSDYEAEKDQAQPWIELFALSAPLDADLCVIVTGAREDPGDGVRTVADVAQSALIAFVVDGRRGRPRISTWRRPITWEGGRLRPEPFEELPDVEDFWLAAMAAAMMRGRSMRATDLEIAQQLQRVTRLGHVVNLHEPVARRLWRALDEARQPAARH